MDPLHRRRLLVSAVSSLLAVSLPCAVRGADESPSSTKLPLFLFQDGDATGVMEVVAPRWMGSVASASCDLEWSEGPLHGSNCVRIEQRSGGRWNSLIWQKSGEVDAFDLTGVSRVTFWARGDKGGEKVDFKFSVYPESRLVRMTGPMLLRSVQLTNEWAAYSINLENRNLGPVKLGVALSVLCPEEGTTIYLDSISIE